MEEIRTVLSGDDGLAAVVSLLHERLPHFSWVGFYHLEGNDLVLGPWRGPAATEHVRIPLGQGGEPPYLDEIVPTLEALEALLVAVSLVPSAADAREESHPTGEQ